jgi:hypothetical protein
MKSGTSVTPISTSSFRVQGERAAVFIRMLPECHTMAVKYAHWLQKPLTYCAAVIGEKFVRQLAINPFKIDLEEKSH